MQRRIVDELRSQDVKLVLCEQTISPLLKQCLDLVGIQAIQDIGQPEVLILSDVLGNLCTYNCNRMSVCQSISLILPKDLANCWTIMAPFTGKVPIGPKRLVVYIFLGRVSPT